MPATDSTPRERSAHHRGVKAALLVLLVPSIALAEERMTMFSLGGMAGAFERPEHELDPEVLFGPRLTLSWEHPALAMPDAPGYRFGGALVPELIGGAFVLDDRAEMFIGAGVRAEVKMAQREQGLLKVSARGSAYVAARGLIVGEQRSGFAEFGLGDYLLVGRATRIGFEGSVVIGRTQYMDGVPQPNVGGVVQFYVGWAP